MLSIWMCIERTSFSVIENVIIIYLTATSSRTFICNTFFSRDQGHPMDFPWYEAPQLSLDASEVIVNCGGEIIKDLLLYKLRFCDHHSNSAFLWVERVTITSQKFWVIIPWTCWCWRDQYWREVGKTATAIENSHPISLLNSLTVTVSFLSSPCTVFVSFPLSSWEGSM